MTALTGDAIVTEALKFKNDPYVYGGAGPTSFDCSGLVQYVFGQLGVKLPRTSEAQYAAVQHISRDQLQPGDLVFAQFSGDNASPGHVGIYVGNGQVYSAQDEALGIGDASLSSWGSAIVGYGRVSGTATGASTTADTTTGILGIPGDITSFFGEANDFVTAAMWIVKPSSWLRIGAFAIGIVLLIIAIYAIAKPEGESILPKIVPVPV